MNHKRDGFTLVEMLIVLAIIAALAALIAFTLPGFQERSRAAKAGSALQGWLNYSRQRAQYEQAPRGMRFWVQESNEYPGLTPAFYVVYKAQYLEKPDDWKGGPLLADPANPNDPKYVKVSGANFSDGTVEEGDYLEINGTGQVHWIVTKQASGQPGIQPSDPVGAPLILDKLLLSPPGLPNPIVEPIKDYRIIRKPRIAGEEPLTLPQNVVVDITTDNEYAKKVLSTSFLPPLIQISATEYYFDILFSPAGNVLDYDREKIVLWVRVEDDDPASEFLKNPTLLVIYASTGAVAAFDPATAANPYANIQK
jgi:prepilin-type N-terminal cleavage/methylation domain-containing protein